MNRWHLVYRDPKTHKWIICETGPQDLIKERLQIAQAAPGNVLKWSMWPLGFLS